MAGPQTVAGLDLSPKPASSTSRSRASRREEFIYFAMVDRFHDGAARGTISQPGRSRGIAAGGGFYGGKIGGITRNLDYIAGLGCTAIWLSPVFENNAGAYHGHNINNYLDIDPNFGTKQDLIDLVDAAHGYTRNGEPWSIRIILDVVINHSGDNWRIRSTPCTCIPTINSFPWTPGGARTVPSPPCCATRPTTTGAGTSRRPVATIPAQETSTVT